MIYRIVLSVLVVAVMAFAVIVSQDGEEQHGVPVAPAGAAVNPNYNL